MKKLTLGLVVLLSGVATNSVASLSNGGSKYGACVPNFCGGFTFGLAGLYWRPSSPELDHALTYPNTDFFDLVDGHYHDVNPYYDWGYKVNIGYVMPCSANDVTFSWTHYHHDDTDRVDNPALLFPTLTSDFNAFSPFAGVFPPFPIGTVVLPDIIVTGIIGADTPVSGTLVAPILTIPITPADLDVATAKADFKNTALDLDFAQSVNVGCNLHLRWCGGLRYAKVETKLNATYEAADIEDTSTLAALVLVSTEGGPVVGGVFVTIGFDFLASIREVVNQKSDFEGIGPRFGVDASYALGGGFGLVGGLCTSLLIGEIDSSLFASVEDSVTAVVTSIATDGSGVITDIVLTVDGAVLEVGTTFVSTDAAELSYKHPDETRIVPNIDAKLGLDYTYAFCNSSKSKLTIEAGWMVSHYFNAVDRLSQVGAVGPEFRSRHTTDVSFDGPYIGIQVNI